MTARRTVADVMQQLSEDHRNFARLLAILERQLALFDRAERPDYELLTAITDYFTGFPDRCHHPKEDLILRRMREKDPVATETVGDLEAEHEKLGERVQRFKEAVQNVLKEIEMPRSAFDAVLRHFIEDQRQHMLMENERFFPLAQKILTDKDWAEIDRAVSKEQDPLFGSEAAEEFESLRQSILRWEAEDREASG